MRWLIKSLVSLILIVMLFIIFIYTFIQTQWGAQKTSEWLTQYTDYDIRFAGIEHDLMQPAQVIIHDVSFKPKQNNTTITAQIAQMDLGLTFFTSPWHLQKITLENGKISLMDNTLSVPLSSDILQLNNIDLTHNQANIHFIAEKMTGGITPWQPTENNLWGAGRFQFSIAKGKLNNDDFSQLLISGQYQPNQIIITQLGTQFLKGSLSLSGQYQNNQWVLNDVYLNGIRWQSDKTLTEWVSTLIDSPDIKIKQLNIVDLTAEGKQWAISDFDGKFSQIDWQNTLSFTAGEFDANHIVIQENQISDVIAKLNQQSNQLNIEDLSLRYEKGLIKLSGSWNKNTKTLTLQTGTLSGLLYTLPEDWLLFLDKPLNIHPDIQNINIGQLSINQSIIINILPAFPFQFTGLTGKIDNIAIAQNGQWGIWQGRAQFSADSGTLNGIDIRRPDLNIVTQQDNAIAEQFSAFVNEGILRGAAALEQDNGKRWFSLMVNGINVPLSLPHRFGWPSPAKENVGKFKLKLKGDLRAETIKSTLTGSLISTQDDQELLNEDLNQGEVMNAQ